MKKGVLAKIESVSEDGDVVLEQSKIRAHPGGRSSTKVVSLLGPDESVMPNGRGHAQSNSLTPRRGEPPQDTVALSSRKGRVQVNSQSSLDAFRPRRDTLPSTSP